MSVRVLLGDEAVGLAAVHAGITAAYAYPGTPSTEILEFILQDGRDARGSGRAFPQAAWCANEKTAYEAALGMSIAGRRSLVAMKHVGLNVAADPFINSALVAIDGGLAVAVADDPGMHSSQNEQDSRVLADFARIICLEPRDQQQAYDMTREAFDLSERFGIPVLVRLVTRLAHSRASVHLGEPLPQRPAAKKENCAAEWILLPSIARRRWRGGYPFVERALRSVLPPAIEIGGRESGALPLDGELTPDVVRHALGLPGRDHQISPISVPDRPPQLCAGCPHTATFEAARRDPRRRPEDSLNSSSRRRLP